MAKQRARGSSGALSINEHLMTISTLLAMR
jgi:hypothetical protein